MDSNSSDPKASHILSICPFSYGWFIDRRGLAIGVMTNANAAGQIVFLPLLMSVILASGWRSALMMITATAALLIPAIWFWMRDNPADVGLEPYR